MRGARSGSVERRGDGMVRFMSGSIAKGNPNTGKPHTNDRERARNARRAAKKAAV